MNKIIHNLLLHLWSTILPLRIHMDARDNTITINRSLHLFLQHMGIRTNPGIYLFRISESRDYGFCLQTPELQEAPLSRISYNAFFDTYGFEALCPTINQIFYTWSIKEGKQLYQRVHYHTGLPTPYLHIPEPTITQVAEANATPDQEIETPNEENRAGARTKFNL